jgi:hypothetical protein
MGAGRVPLDRLPEGQLGRRLMAIPLALIVVITVVDIHSPPDVHLGPLLVIAPTLTASLAGAATDRPSEHRLWPPSCSSPCSTAD